MEEKLVATTSLCDYPEGAVQKPSIGGWSNGVKIQEIMDLNPDIVVASDDLQNNVVDDLETAGLDVLQFKPHTLQGVFESINQLGVELGCEDQAHIIVQEMKKGISQIDLKSKRIYCEEWMDPPMVSGNWIPGIIQKANGKYLIKEGQRSRKTDFKRLKEFDPEYIFLNVCGAGRNVSVSEVLDREDWSEITAVKNENVYAVDDALLNRPGPRLVEGVKKIEELI